MQYFFQLLALPLVFTSSVGCMSLTKEGATVRVITGDPANDCTEIGTLKGYGLGREANGREWATNDLRDSAARKGATHLRIEGESTSATGDTELTAIAFRCPDSAPPATLE